MFLPINQEDLKKRNIEQLDFIIISGDAYIDHPSFGVAIIGRMLERHGYTVGIIAQPNIEDDDDFFALGTPKLAFLVSSGNIDSMVNHYTVSKRRRSKDLYTPGGKMGKRPDYAVKRYSNKVRQLFFDVPIILGGIEASLRRLAHYDYWSDGLKPSILIDAKADLLIYGMAEKGLIEVADSLASGLPIKDIIYVRGTVYKTNSKDYVPYDAVNLPTYDELLASTETFARSEHIKLQHLDYVSAEPLVEKYRHYDIVQNPPQPPLSKEEFDQVYELPYERKVHPYFEALGHVPAIEEVKFSIIANRGCYGGCNFCALTYHQGRQIQSRSKESILREAKQIIDDVDFKGYIHDVGGPTANFYEKACKKQEKLGVCLDKDCIGETVCNALNITHKNYLDILRDLRQLDGVKKVFVRSGIRYDYLLYDKDEQFFSELVKHHVSGQLKVAPEHVSDNVLHFMNKPKSALYDEFMKKFYKYNDRHEKNQFLVPYLMSSHPGSTLEDAVMLAEYVRDLNYNPEQVQDFYPTPATPSTCMYYTGINPKTMEHVYVPKSKHEKAMQRALIQYRNPKNYQLVKEALQKTNRSDLIGHHKKALIRPR
ncbi:MAG: YgiQ family radical SAM protein [Candidatus Izemoplasmataceae bacterium]